MQIHRNNNMNNYEKNVSKRFSNFELLRIFAMTSIVLCHFIMAASRYLETISDTYFYYFCMFFKGWTGAFGNILFMLISGYFLCTSDFKWQKVLKFWLNVFSVSAVCGLVFYILKIPCRDYNLLESNDFLASARPVTTVEFLKSLAPTLLGAAWYASKYFVFLILSPFCRLLLDKLDRQKHFYLLVIMFILGTVTKMIPAQRLYDPASLFYFIFAYYLAAYIRFYEPALFSSKNKNLILGLLCLIIFASWNVFLTVFVSRHPELEPYKRFFHITELHMFPIWISAVFIFNFFRLLRTGHSRVINAVSASTFDVYLLHTNFALGPFMWHAILHMNYLLKSDYPFTALLAIPGIFAVSMILHQLRIVLIERPVFPILEALGKHLFFNDKKTDC